MVGDSSDKEVATLSDAQVRHFRKSVSNFVAILWMLSVVMLAAAAGWGAAPGAKPQEWHAWQEWKGALGFLLFPGLHVMAFLWWNVLAPHGTQLPTGPALTGLILLGVLIGLAFWTWLVPWVLTAFRIYLWPYARRRPGP
jgi:hypothetical protein